jgi:hypothetical protein
MSDVKQPSPEAKKLAERIRYYWGAPKYDLETDLDAFAARAVERVLARLCEYCAGNVPSEFNHFLDDLWWHKHGPAWLLCKVSAAREKLR